MSALESFSTMIRDENPTPRRPRISTRSSVCIYDEFHILYQFFESQKLWSEIVDERETSFFHIFPVERIRKRHDSDRSLFHRGNSLTREILSKVRKIVIMSDNHENGSISFCFCDDIEMYSFCISFTHRSSIVELIYVFDLEFWILAMESFCCLSRSFGWTRHDTIRFDSDEPEILRDDSERLFAMFGKGAIEVHTIEIIDFDRFRMTHQDDLFFLRIMEHALIIYKNTPIQVGVFFRVDSRIYHL